MIVIAPIPDVLFVYITGQVEVGLILRDYNIQKLFVFTHKSTNILETFTRGFTCSFGSWGMWILYGWKLKSSWGILQPDLIDTCWESSTLLNYCSLSFSISVVQAQETCLTAPPRMPKSLSSGTKRWNYIMSWNIKLSGERLCVWTTDLVSKVVLTAKTRRFTVLASMTSKLHMY